MFKPSNDPSPDAADARRPGVIATRAGASGSAPAGRGRIRVHGKFLYACDQKLYVKGSTYGSFEPDADGLEYHDLSTIERDFELMVEAGMNCVRIPHTMPPVFLLDAAERAGLRVMVGLSAEQFAGYLIGSSDARDIGRIVREKLRPVVGHPALLCYALGNEIPASTVRWLGRRKVERYLEHLYEVVKDEDPASVVTYVNYPTTEYLDLPFLDLLSFNVYLEVPDRLDAYLARLHTLAGDRPLLMSEVGLDALRNGEDKQAEAVDWQIRRIFAAGCAGAFVFSWTDEWFRGNGYVHDWAFGLTRYDRSPKPALAAASAAFADAPFPQDRQWPRASVVVCTYNGAGTLRESLGGMARVEYPDLEVIVVDDGSTDDSAEIAEAFGARTISTENAGLSAARNVGATAATGEIVAYVDDDAWPDPHWLQYLADTFERTDFAAVGGPNIPPPDASPVAESVAHAPGGPIHVLVSDTEAEHIPGCNFAIRKGVLLDVGGFDPRFRAAGDDVDLCWRLQEAGHRIGFNPAAVVWHRRRDSVRAYWRQQRGYGRAEALLERKWPERYNALGHVSWHGRVYGNSFARLLGFRRSRIYGGVWGMAPFQSLYQASPSLIDSLARLPEWYLVVAYLGLLSVLASAWSPLLYVLPVLAVALLLPISDAVYAGLRTHFDHRPARLAWRLRALTSLLHLSQPVARLAGRIRAGLVPWRRRGSAGFAFPRTRSLAVWSEIWREHADWLAELEESLRRTGMAVRLGHAFAAWDLEVRSGFWGSARILFAAEDHAAGNQYLRYRIKPVFSASGAILVTVPLSLSIGAALSHAWIEMAILQLTSAIPLVAMVRASGHALWAVRVAIEDKPCPVEDEDLASELGARVKGFVL